MSSKRAGIIWVDAQGEQSLNVITTASGVGAIETALQAKSNAGIVECWEGPLETFTTTPTVATYPSNRTVAILLFQDSLGSSGRLYIPSPVTSIFDSSGNIVDPTQVSSIISAAIGNLRAGNGNAVTMFVGGYLSKAPVRALESTDVVAFQNPMTTTGDMIYATDNAGSAGRLGIGSSGNILEVVGGIPSWQPAPIGLPLTTNLDQLSSDVSMASPNTFYDGASLSLGVGKWLVFAGWVVASSLTTGALTSKIWDGASADYVSQLTDYAADGDAAGSLAAVITLSGTTTVKLSVAATGVSATLLKAAARFNGAGNNATYLMAAKVG